MQQLCQVSSKSKEVGFKLIIYWVISHGMTLFKVVIYFHQIVDMTYFHQKLKSQGVGSMKLGDIEFVYSGRKDGVHRQGVGLMMNKEAAKSCFGWEGINNRILIAHFMTKKFRVSVIVVYAPVEPTDGDTSDSDEFYLQLQEQIDRVPGRNMVFLLEILTPRLVEIGIDGILA